MAADFLIRTSPDKVGMKSKKGGGIFRRIFYLKTGTMSIITNNYLVTEFE
jgi:hypothetical protein